MTMNIEQYYSGQALTARKYQLEKSSFKRQQILEKRMSSKEPIEFHTNKLKEFVVMLRWRKLYLRNVRIRRSLVQPSSSPSPSKRISQILNRQFCPDCKTVKQLLYDPKPIDNYRKFCQYCKTVEQRLYRQFCRHCKTVKQRLNARKQFSRDCCKTKDQRLYDYKPIDGYKYGVLMWLQRGEDMYDLTHNTISLRYKVTIHFMYRLRSGIVIKVGSVPYDIPSFTFDHSVNCWTTTSSRNNKYNLHVGLGAVIVGLGIPDSCTKAMLKNISNFAAANHNAGNLTLCVEIQIATLQPEGEDVLETRLSSQVNGFCRSDYIKRLLLEKEADLQPVRLLQVRDASFAYNIFQEDDLEEEKDRCSICLEELRDVCSCLPCSHVHHYRCIFKSMSHYNFCPLCRHRYRRVACSCHSSIECGACLSE